VIDKTKFISQAQFPNFWLLISYYDFQISYSFLDLGIAKFIRANGRVHHTWRSLLNEHLSQRCRFHWYFCNFISKLAGIICPTPSLFHISLLTRRRLLFLDRLDQHSDGTNSIHYLLHTLDKRIKYCVNFPEKPSLFRNNWKAPRRFCVSGFCSFVNYTVNYVVKFRTWDSD
jgi:hypothetical protein